MVKYIINLLGIDVLPKWLLTHFLLMSLALGGFNAVFFIQAVSGFLAEGKVAYFPEIITLSGIIGLLLYNLYKYYTGKYTPSYSWLIFWVIVLVLLSLSKFLPLIIPVFSHQIIQFALYLPIVIISNQIFLSMGNSLPIVKENQNLRRFLDSGLMLGAALVSFITVILAIARIYLPFFTVEVILMFFLVIDYFFIVRQLDFEEKKQEETGIDSMIAIFTEISPKQAVFSLVLFCVFSTINFIFIEFAFFTVIRSVYTDVTNLIKFIGFFFGSLMMVNIVFKVFVYQNLVKTFRISKALFLSPFFFVGSLVILNLLLLNPNRSIISSPFTLVFLVVLFSRFFAFLLRESFENLSVKQYFIAIETFNRKDLSRNLFNVIGFWSFLFSGLVLLMLLALDIKTFSFILQINLIIAFIWLLLTIWNSKRYTNTIGRLVNKLTIEFKPGFEEQQKSFKDRVMISTNLSGMRYLLNYQRHYQPNNFLKTIEAIPVGIKEKLKISTPAESFSPSALFDIFSNREKAINFYDSEDNCQDTDIEVLATSHRIKDRINALKMIEKSGNSKYFTILKLLLRDNDDEVKRNAIISLATFYNFDLINELLGYIDHEDFSDLTADVLTTIGSPAFEPLVGLFHQSNIEFRIQVKIIKIIGKISGHQSTQFLLNAILYPNKWVVIEVVKSLIESNYKGSAENSDTINTAIINTIGAAAWLLTMEASIEPLDRLNPVKRAIGEEYSVTIDLLFKLLALKYSEGVIHEVKGYLIGNSNNEQSELSVELLDHIIDNDIKKYLFPLLHNNRLGEKLNQLKELYPIDIKDVTGALREILNTDLGHVSLWTKACAVSAFIDILEDPNSEDVLSQVFNPDPLLSEVAFFGIYKKDKRLASEVYKRLSKKAKNHIDLILDYGVKFEYKLLYNKVLTLQKISHFQKVKGHHLLPFAEILKEEYLKSGNTTFLQCSDEEVLPVFMIPFGEVSLVDLHKRVFRLNRDYLYGLGLYAGGIKLNAYSDAVIYLAKSEQIGSLVINYEELSDALFKYIQNSNFY
jgi:hypothetical protein